MGWFDSSPGYKLTQNNMNIETPITYRIEFSTIRWIKEHEVVSYSLRIAIRRLLYYQDKFRGKKVVRLHAYRGDLRLRDITQDVLNLIQ